MSTPPSPTTMWLRFAALVRQGMNPQAAFAEVGFAGGTSASNRAPQRASESTRLTRRSAEILPKWITGRAGRYRIEQHLGTGGSASAYRAQRVGHNAADVVIKLLR